MKISFCRVFVYVASFCSWWKWGLSRTVYLHQVRLMLQMQTREMKSSTSSHRHRRQQWQCFLLQWTLMMSWWAVWTFSRHLLPKRGKTWPPLLHHLPLSLPLSLEQGTTHIYFLHKLNYKNTLDSLQHIQYCLCDRTYLKHECAFTAYRTTKMSMYVVLQAPAVRWWVFRWTIGHFRHQRRKKKVTGETH